MRLEKEVALLHRDNALLKSEIERKNLLLDQSNHANSAIEHKQDSIRKIYEAHEKEIIILSGQISSIQGEKQ